MLENSFFIEVKNFVFALFKSDLPAQVLYHNYDHTLNVVNAAQEIGLGEELSEDELEIVLLAAWFHDTGFIHGFENHEEKSISIVTDYLTDKQYPKEKLDSVINCILATRMPQKPTNKMEEVICDADLYHLGTEFFQEKTSLLRMEWETLCDKHYTEIEWLDQNEKFLNEHNYFTNYAFNKLSGLKSANWVKIQKSLKKAQIKKEEQDQKLQLKENDLKRKLAKENRPDRGIETMYRVTLRNHIKLSDIADTKANILLSVNAIILSIALTTIFPKLDKADNQFLVWPTMIFIMTSVVSMIFAILSTRPKVTSGTFTKEDVKNKKVNLLFFGNFHKMPLNEFEEGLKEMTKDRDYLYNSLSKDLYFLGVVLERKYRLLRITYNIFMVGIITSVLAFVLSFLIMKYGGIGIQ